MTISAAIEVLERCNWLKLSQTHVSAARWKLNSAVRAHVAVRKRKGESLEMLLIRAATLVEANHMPTRRVPPLTSTDRCACGAQTHDLVFNQQLKQRVCRRCDARWITAAFYNDMAPTYGQKQ